jgi:catalase (peroxidase I)
MHSYQNDPEYRPLSTTNSTRRTSACSFVTAGLLALGALVLVVSFINYSYSDETNDPAALLLGSSHKKSSKINPGLQLPGYPPLIVQQEYWDALQKVDWKEVEKDMTEVLYDSKDWWPADYGIYGGLFVRLSWHSCGSYRMSDGRGGCDGGGQRFDPERSWPDNTNLDKARRLLEPIKLKHGIGVSYGDLFALAGTVAIKEMGGPVLGFCAGTPSCRVVLNR